MKILAYGRRNRGSSAADQVGLAEAWARGRGHEVLRLAQHKLDSRTREYPPREDVLGACVRKLVGGVALVDLAALGPDLAGVLTELERAGASVLVIGDEKSRPMELGPSELALASEIARAVDRTRRLGHAGRRRICPPRVPVDVAAVRARQAAGATLAAISAELGCGRGVLVRRLSHEREVSR